MIFARQHNIFIFCLVLVVMGGVGILRWQHLSSLPVYEDEIISMTVTQEIASSGISRLPTGYAYLPGLIPNVLSAAVVHAFGSSLVTHRFVSYIAGIFALLLMYLCARKFFSLPVALATLLFFSVSRFEFTLGGSARMYIVFQLLTLALVLLFHRGFIERQPHCRALFVVFFLCAVFTHIGAIVLLPAFFGYLFIKNPRDFLRKEILSFPFIFCVIISTASIMMNRLPGTPPGIFQNHPVVGLFLDTGYHAHVLERYLPLSLLFFIVYAFGIFKRWRKAKSAQYIFILFCVVFFIVSILVPATSRYVFFIFPLYVMIVFDGFKRAVTFFSQQVGIVRYGGYCVLCLIIGIHAVVGGFLKTSLAYGFKSTQYDYSQFYEYARSVVGPHDIVLCTDQVMALWYFRCDYIFRQKKGDHDLWTSFPASSDEYRGIPHVDSLPSFRGILTSYKRVWLLADKKFWGNASPVMMGYALQVMQRVYAEEDGEIGLYVHDSGSVGAERMIPMQ